MPRRDQFPIGPAPAAGGRVPGSRKLPDELPPAAGSGQPTPPALTGDQVERWAGLIASGESEFPHDLAPADEARLLDAVRRLRRARLMKYLARQVALDLHGRGVRSAPGPGNTTPLRREKRVRDAKAQTRPE